MNKRDPLNYILLGIDYFVRQWNLVVGRFRFAILCAFWGVPYGKIGRFVGKTIIRTLRRGDIVLGNNVMFISGQRMNPIIATTPTVLTTLHGGKITIGDGCRMTSPFIGSAEEVKIGNNVMVSGGVKIMDTNFHSVDHVVRRIKLGDVDGMPLPVEIGDDVFIGLNATILKGSRIGARSIVAANSVVSCIDVPDDSIVFGNPAIVKKARRIKH